MTSNDRTQRPGGIDDAVDQAVRRAAFVQANPEWHVWHDRQRDVWLGERTAPGGWETHARFTLGWLLDAIGAP